jgi:anaerobic selenocysteine-containing dehydrogenase
MEKLDQKKVSRQTEEDMSVVIGTGLAGLGPGGAASVADMKNGKIVRLRPLHYDWKYDPDKLNAWKIEARGKTLEPRMKTLSPAFGTAYKKRVYSPNRILYPLKRVDWDPNGERNPQNRGVSKYERISWDEATDIIVSELKRVRAKYGPFGVLAQCDGHGESKLIHKCHGNNDDLLKILGEYTLQVRNTDSWEGWNWGAKHAWGMSPVGLQGPGSNLLPDVIDFAGMILFWGCDPETTPGGQNGQAGTRICYFFKEIGIASVYVCPDLNYGAAVHADKWIPIRPGTDAALQLAIAYQWITQGTYKKEYIKTHAFGFEKFEDYVLGKEDGIPKTAEWASTKCAVPEWTIKALASEWAAKITSILHGNGGPGIRSAYSTENARLEVFLLAMQGLGGPGVHQIKMLEWQDTSGMSAMPGGLGSGMIRANTTYLKSLKAISKGQSKMAGPPPGGPPSGGPKQAAKDDAAECNKLASCPMPEDAKSGTPTPPPGKQGPPPGKKGSMSAFPEGFEIPKPPRQFIPRDKIHDALLNPPISWYGITWGTLGTEDQFQKFTYPIPKEQGGTEVHMIWTDAPCWITCWNDSNMFIKALRSPKIEFILAEHPWLENDCLFADVILPITTKFENNDIGADSGSGQFAVIADEKRCVEPIGEAKSDYEAVCMIADKLGVLEQFTGGQTIEEKKELIFKGSDANNLTTYKELVEKGYYVFPGDPNWKKQPVGLRGFYEDPENNPLETPSGKIEFMSQNLAKHFPNDEERPPVPHWVEKGVSHDERVSSERAKRYPLLVLSNHPRWRMHANCDDITWTRECPTCKVKGWDGYLYEPLWINTKDAEARGIENGDIVKVYNERGIVLGGAYVSERVTSGSVSMDHGARYDAILPGEIDRGGAINTITPHNTTSKNATGMAVSSFLVEVEKVTEAQMGEWKAKYPAAFERKYDPAAGIRFDAWIVNKGVK